MVCSKFMLNDGYVMTVADTTQLAANTASAILSSVRSVST